MSNSQLTLTMSSNTLFHFTDKKGLIGILRDGFFKPNYCKVDLNLFFRKDSDRSVESIRYFPMVCFCDIPLSHTKVHMKNYDKYGIGLRKDWGIKKKISPVLYAHNNSEIFIYVGRLFQQVNNNQDNRSHLQGIFSMVKPYKGKLRKNGKEIRFYDEREWRFVPRPPDSISKQIYDNSRKRNMLKTLLPPLEFESASIKCIIVPNYEDISDIMEAARQNKKYGNETESLRSKVISSKMIEEDF